MESYHGFEQGPIRPPSEARSLLLRVTRNCPWNRCTFCPVYKQESFSIRPPEHVKHDIDAIHQHLLTLQRLIGADQLATQYAVVDTARRLPPTELPAFKAACHWLIHGDMKSVFLQDANSLALKMDQLLEILAHLRKRFPQVERVTSYARSSSVALLQPAQLAALQAAGLTRLHIGLESGSDAVLRRAKKGATKKLQILAGQRVKAAGIELSEYVIPGLGGRELSEEHALETADALNQIAPDFIRIRSLVIPTGVPLYAAMCDGAFVSCTEVEVQAEILRLLQNLHGITSKIRSDHIMNLLPEVHGTLPQDRDRMITALLEFLNLSREEQLVYRVGRRLGLFDGLQDLQNGERRWLAEQNVHQLGATSQNCDVLLDDLVRRFV